MAEQKNDNKPQKLFDVLRKKSKEKLEAFIYKGENTSSDDATAETIPVVEEAPKHPLFELWQIWQKDAAYQSGTEDNATEKVFLNWFGLDIDLEIKKEEKIPEDLEQNKEDEAAQKIIPRLWRDKKEETLAQETEDIAEEEPKPEPTAEQLFCDSLTRTAESMIKEIQMEYRIAESEYRARQELAKLHAKQPPDSLEAKLEEAGLSKEDLDDENREALGIDTEEDAASEIAEDADDQPEEEDSIKMKPRDAVVKSYISKDIMTGLLFVFPPLFGGKPIDEETLGEALKKGKIIYGIDTEHLNRIINNQQYMKIHTIAQGLLPVAGTDGKIIDHISRVEKINVMEDDRGQVDFKQLNIIQNIKKGDPICTLVPPIPGINGKNVSGKVIPCAKTVMPKTPQGNNTVMSADGTQLLAAMDGFASFQYDRFNVENKLVVSGSVDNSVGNINFIGDVYIRGDVLNGFEVRAGGDIHVAGMVEGAFLYAGKNVKIDKGMNGNKQGFIVAGGEVNCRFLENCTIHAVGSVQADSMVWCDVTSDDSVIAQSGKGAIIGGSIVARNSVSAQVIGNKSHQKTNITLGYSSNILKERESSEKELAESKTTLDTLTKNIAYLSKLHGLSLEKQELLNQLVHQKKLYEVKKKALLNRLAELDNEISDFTGCYVDGEMIFPPTQVTIGTASRTISNVWFKCHVYFADGEIKFGTAVE